MIAGIASRPTPAAVDYRKRRRFKVWSWRIRVIFVSLLWVAIAGACQVGSALPRALASSMSRKAARSLE